LQTQVVYPSGKTRILPLPFLYIFLFNIKFNVSERMQFINPMQNYFAQIRSMRKFMTFQVYLTIRISSIDTLRG